MIRDKKKKGKKEKNRRIGSPRDYTCTQNNEFATPAEFLSATSKQGNLVQLYVGRGN